jgi:Rha family phage regulatory protein
MPRQRVKAGKSKAIRTIRKEVQSMNDLVFEKNEQAMTDSLKVADYFGKQHKRVLQDIRELDCSAEFSRHNFVPSKRKDERGKWQPTINMTFDGFMFLAMGYRGKRAAALKEAYIAEFNRMRSFIQQLAVAKADFHEVTEAIKLMKPDHHSYDFTNEFNMINVIVLGMTAKKFKAKNKLAADIDSIRPYLTPEELDGVDRLQKFDASLIIIGTVYEDRKRALEEYWKRIQAMKQSVLKSA